MAVVVLRAVDAVDLTAAGPLIALLTLEAGDPAAGKRGLQISGIALGVRTLTVTAAASADRQSATAIVGAGGHFSASLTVAARADLDFLIIEAKDDAAGTGAFDRCAAQLGLPGQINLPDATLANFDPRALSYLAGLPDRIIPSRTFVLLHLPPELEKNAKYAALYLGALDGQIARIAPSLLKKMDAELAALAKSVDESKLSIGRYYDEAESRLAGMLESDAGPLKEGPAKNVKARIQAALGAGKPKRGTVPAVAGRVVAFGTGSQREVFAPIKIDKGEFGPTWIKGIRAAQRVGVLFSDRLRVAPVGLVVGEPLYKLALSPGEEVQLRQTSETRKRVSLSDIKDRESEETLTLSSTLSTDLTTTISDTRSFQSQVSLGGGLSGTIPETPIGVSVDAGSNSSSAHSNSVSETAAFHNETSSTSMARLRAQHKTTLEISNEETTGYTTTRTLRNTNQQRSQIHTFFKLYRKERITLERHDAQLCLKFEVLDPAREARAAFLSRFHRIDPNNPDNFDLPEFGDLVLSKQAPALAEPADQQATALIGGKHDRWRPLDIADIGAFLGAPAGYELIDSPRMTMTQVQVFTENSDIAGAEGLRTFESNLTRMGDLPANVEVQQAFITSGGNVRATRYPKPLASNRRLTLDVNFAFKMEGRPPVVPFIELGSKITSVTFNLSATFGPGAGLSQERADKILRRKREVAAAFDPASVYALGENARADYPGSVIDRALAENFGHLSLEQLAQFGRYFDLDKSIIETVPFWANRSASDIHLELKLLLERLPKPVSSEAVLTPEVTGALAFVYLPIRHGMESAALALLKEISSARRAALVDDFRNLRESRFGLARPAMGGAPVDTPVNPAGTPAGATVWANSWETSMRKHEVLAEWSDLTPTDGLHLETQLSATTGADEHATARLEKLD
jgi:hypothetical protein